MRASSSGCRTAGAALPRAPASTARGSSASSTGTSASACRTRAGPTSRTAAASRADPSSPAISSSSTARAMWASTWAADASSTRRTAEPASASRRWVSTRATTAPGVSRPARSSAHLFGHGGEQLPGDRRVGLDERSEVPRRHAVAEHVRPRRQRGGARRLVDERDLAEVVAGPDRAFRLAADLHVGLALLDDEEADAAGALLRHGVAGPEAALAHAARDLLQLLVVEPREERDLLQHVDGGSGHGAFIHSCASPCEHPCVAARIGACASTSSAALPPGPTRAAPSRGISSRRTAAGFCSTAVRPCCPAYDGWSRGRGSTRS